MIEDQIAKQFTHLFQIAMTNARTLDANPVEWSKTHLKLLIEDQAYYVALRIQSFPTKEHFLLYAGRCVRRPPIAQKRITEITETSVTFWAKDKKLNRSASALASSGSSLATPQQNGRRERMHLTLKNRHNPQQGSYRRESSENRCHTTPSFTKFASCTWLRISVGHLQDDVVRLTTAAIMMMSK